MPYFMIFEMVLCVRMAGSLRGAMCGVRGRATEPIGRTPGCGNG